MNFQHIVPRFGGRREAFEDLCCQLARRSIPETAKFVRLHGSGGDGGVECFANLPDGSRIGWQAKYVTDIQSLLTQGNSSLDTALQIHPTLTKYILCFPFDLTGPTGRRGQSSLEKFEAWREEKIEQIAESGRSLEIEEWSANQLYSILMEVDVSGGISTFFFNDNILSSEWFFNHIQESQSIAGPRYTPELNVLTNVGKWLAAFGRTPEWIQQIQNLSREARKHYRQFSTTIRRIDKDPANSNWPSHILDKGLYVSDMIKTALEIFDMTKNLIEISDYHNSLSHFDKVISELSLLEDALVEDLEKQHGRGRADSPGFRQFMAEHMVSFPAANLDITRDMRKALIELHGWLESPTGILAFHSAFVLSGAWGVGKTHVVCDVASQRLEKGFLSCVIFGHHFDGNPDPWTRLAESLGLPTTFGKDKLLDMLNTAAEGSGQLLILFIDAINETRPLRYWRRRLLPIIGEIEKRRNLRICFTCRTSYLDYCLPESHDLFISEHPGFKGAEHFASTAFFRYYELKPPIAPILQPEFGNPLYLRLACETVRSLGMDRLPLGWIGTQSMISSFLKMKEKEFAQYMGVSKTANIVTNSLCGIARNVAQYGMTKISRTRTIQIIQEIWPYNREIDVVDWLVHENLLIEEVPDNTNIFDTDSTVRLAFERLGDLLIASQLLSEFDDNTSIDSAFTTGGRLNALVRDLESIGENYGILSALSIMIPERYPGKELSSLTAPDEVHDSLLKIVIFSIPWRDAESFSYVSEDVLLEALNNSKLRSVAIDNLLSISWRPSTIDSLWLHKLLNNIPLAKRDAYWCYYLHRSYEDSNPVKRLIDAAFGLDFDTLDEDVAERWATVLLWFTAAADRRIKDWATRALVKIFVSCTIMIPTLLKRFLSIDDDAIRERLMLASYGALIISRDAEISKQSVDILQYELCKNPIYFDNALLRDHVRCIVELAHKLEALDGEIDSVSAIHPIDSDQPLEVPMEDELEDWGKLLHFKPNEFFSDFFAYSMNCLNQWTHGFSKENMGKWILRRIVRDFCYLGSGCEYYDNYMINTHGSGRSKPIWAERIGKKYQWIAMYQLASRLHDQIERRRDKWEPEPLRTPLILLEERELDPTIPSDWNKREGTDPWWITTSSDIDPTNRLSDVEWVAGEDDIPTLEALLSTIERNGQNWRALVTYPSWEKRNEDADWKEPYRQVWIHINGYLVKTCDFENAVYCLQHRNFFGQWMPSSSSWLYGFAGEYPWAAPFNTETDEWNGLETFGTQLPVAFHPSWSTLIGEWEYDSSVENYHMLVPAKQFFTANDLWWNGKNGYRLDSGRTVFQDPSLSKIGPSTLMGDVDYISYCLNKLEMRLIWTLLGEKWILGNHSTRQIPGRTFSQIAYLNEDNSVHVGDRMFFANYNQDTGPRTIE